MSYVQVHLVSLDPKKHCELQFEPETPDTVRRFLHGLSGRSGEDCLCELQDLGAITVDKVVRESIYFLVMFAKKHPSHKWKVFETDESYYSVKGYTFEELGRVGELKKVEFPKPSSVN